MMDDLQEAFDKGFEAVKAYVDKSLARFEERISAVERRPAPKDGDPGKSVTVDEIRPVLQEMVDALPKAEKGKDADPEMTRKLIEDEVARVVGEIPKPKDGDPGKSVSVEDVRPLIVEAVEKAVSAIPTPKDGIGLAGALIDREGHLVVTLTDGSQRQLGVVVGKDAKGKDGFGFEDLSVAFDGERTLTLVFEREDERKEFPVELPIVIYRGVWSEGSYKRGDCVSFGGSSWIAQKDTETKPETVNSDWRLSIKRGRDGKDAR